MSFFGACLGCSVHGHNDRRQRSVVFHLCGFQLVLSVGASSFRVPSFPGFASIHEGPKKVTFPARLLAAEESFVMAAQQSSRACFSLKLRFLFGLLAGSSYPKVKQILPRKF